MKETIQRTTKHINSLKLNDIPFFFLACMFLGWNGIQILFSFGLIITFIDSRSMTRLVFTSFQYNIRSIPIYIFAITTFFIIHWIIRIFYEISFTVKINQIEMKFKEIKALALNFFVPNLIMVLAVFLIIGSYFLLRVFWGIASTGFNSSINLNAESTIYYWLYTSIITSVVITIFLTDNVLPRMLKYHTFKGSLLRALIYIKYNFVRFILFNLIKFLLIVFSVFVFQSILRHFILPYFLLLEDQHSFVVLFSSSRRFRIEYVISNIFVMYGVLIAALIVFSPLMAPLYVYQRLLLKKHTGY